MDDIKFEWDPAKASANIKKHGVSFDEAQSVFFDSYARLIPDPDSSFGEERFIILGLSSDFKALVVCHCYREPDDSIRIISARKADKFERKQYEEYRYA
ncbi:BrnT family toxin [Pseudocolwellia sp. AS88]|uniref:BrnT family toxin n=1 Tax=Pseudocolwellia sp. AS88 TaxID=3063958 RepID=UPI0026EBBF7B|nr:BrnT family toxin [Pseudocolwellia sp. AS88]MDO7083700.1 BrnT family toxin [Pseudocolwellia sp. AS88]